MSFESRSGPTRLSFRRHNQGAHSPRAALLLTGATQSATNGSGAGLRFFFTSVTNIADIGRPHSKVQRGELRDVEIYFDGASPGNPGPAGAAAIAYIGGQAVAWSWHYLGIDTNNGAEAYGATAALRLIADLMRNISRGSA